MFIPKHVLSMYVYTTKRDCALLGREYASSHVCDVALISFSNLEIKKGPERSSVVFGGDGADQSLEVWRV